MRLEIRSERSSDKKSPTGMNHLNRDLVPVTCPVDERIELLNTLKRRSMTAIKLVSKSQLFQIQR
jgi:hypothetical protein